MTITIPQQLNEWRFIKLKPRDKIPIEPKWTTTATYGYSDSGLLAHIEAGGNYGVLGSEDHVIVDGDTPEVQRAMEGHLPLTFTVRTPGHQGRHYYFLCKLEKPIRLRDKDKANIGDIQGIGKQVVGPNCIHPNGKTYEVVNDRPPNWVAPNNLKRALKEFIIKEPPSAKFAEGEREALVGEGLKADIKITDVHPPEGMIRRGDEYYGSHPVHGSEGGQNFWINTKKNVWNCFRHDTGGGPLSLLAVKEGIIKCEDAVKGVLRGTEFNQVLKLAREKGLIASKEKEKITDKLVTDAIMGKHLFYCDIVDENQILYLFTGNHWSNAAAESVILNELSDIFKDEERRRGMSLERTVNFIKGQAMNLKVAPKPPELIPFKNGMYNLGTGKLKAHDPKYFYVNLIPHDYAPNARCPKWMKWLAEVLKLEDVQFLQEWMGYNIYEGYPEACFVILIGVGQNGKSCFNVLFKKLVGEKNVTEISLADLTYGDFTPAQLEHKLANISDDIGSTIIKNTSRLKRASAGSGMTVGKKFQRDHDITPYAKLTYSCNEPPEIQETSEAIRLRLKVIEFPYVFVKKPEEGQKQARDRKEVDMELEAEIPGIINWVLEGLKRFLNNDSTFSGTRSTEETWKLYQRKSRPVFSFMEECIKITDDETEKLTIEEMYAALKEWLKQNGVKLRIGRTKMIRDLRDEGIETRQKRENERKRMYYGVTLSHDYSLPVFPQIELLQEIEEKKKKGRKKGNKKRVTPCRKPAKPTEAPK